MDTLRNVAVPEAGAPMAIRIGFNNERRAGGRRSETIANSEYDIAVLEAGRS